MNSRTQPQEGTTNSQKVPLLLKFYIKLVTSQGPISSATRGLAASTLGGRLWSLHISFHLLLLALLLELQAGLAV